MRTKTILLAAAALAAGIAASSAQSVYSVNAVGYVNVTVTNGYNLICNPLNGTNNNLNTIIPVAPDNSQVLRWSGSGQSFSSVDTYFDLGNPTDSGWYNAAFQKTTNSLNPGEAFFFRKPNAGSSTLTFVGEVPQGNLTNQIGTLYGFYSSIVPQSAGLTTMGFPGRNGMQYSRWNAGSQGYVGTLTYFDLGNPADNGWYDAGFNKVDPTPAVGEGFLILNPVANGAQSWGRTFSVN
jgi:hypothetical protein